jgi:aryl-alcohol dehydrogenase-like predicted oxidoreductase
MEHRRLGESGLKVPVLGFGTATFGGAGEVFRAWGTTDVAGAKRMVDICIDADAAFFDTADSYSSGLAEEILGAALAGRRDRALVATKVSTPLSDAPNDRGSSRQHILASFEASLRRLRTDHVDVLYVHEFDRTTPVEETMRVLDDLVTAGKVRYVGASNFSGWHLMKALAVSERRGWVRHVAHQVAYSLALRDYEWELAPLAQDQGVGAVVWSPLAMGGLSGKRRRGQEPPPGSRLAQWQADPLAEAEHVYRIVDVLDGVAAEVGRSVSQVAINWVAHRPTVASVVLGARDPEQLSQNLESVGWRLDADQVARLDAVSEVPAPYPYGHQRAYPMFDPTV